ncbi:MAG: SPOR domain-containing protein [Desulfobacterales bacterium]|nr:SPOR domain-containing protein [Desulfobacterales bacterium]
MAKQADNNLPSGNSGRKSTTLWLCIIFFVSAWMFVLGVLVGRGTAPVHFNIESLQKELASLKEAVQMKEQLWYKNRSEAVPDKPDLEFHEALKKNQVEPRLSLEANRPEKPDENIKKIPAAGNKKLSESTPKPAESVDGPKLRPDNDNMPGNLTIQVAALKEAKFADIKVAELRRKGYPAYRTTGTVPGQGTWYRVRIGSFKDRTAATRMLERLKKENIKGIIVQK